MTKKNIVIVGGGASGMMAAIAAAKAGAKSITVLEQKDRVGKKILSTGNGKCNFTNEYMNEDCFRGDNTDIVADVLKQFGFEDTIRFFEELGILWKSKNGYVYPISEQATAILDILRFELKKYDVCIQTDTKVLAIKKQQDNFVIETNGECLTADAVILATGGKAASKLGSDGSGYQLAKQLGHHISEVVPALVQLHGNGDYFKQVAGVRTHASVHLLVDCEEVACDTGELQLTDYGISGIPVFQISRFASKALARKKNVAVEIDFMPQQSEDDFVQYMTERKVKHANKTAEEFCVGVFHKKLSIMLLKQSGISLNTKIADVKNKQFFEFLHLCKHFQVDITKTNSFEQAQVCAGGVKTTEICSETMESLYVPGLYLVGELLDIDGICGGYNLQWAWATGYIAGTNAVKGK